MTIGRIVGRLTPTRAPPDKRPADASPTRQASRRREPHPTRVPPTRAPPDKRPADASPTRQASRRREPHPTSVPPTRAPPDKRPAHASPTRQASRRREPHPTSVPPTRAPPDKRPADASPTRQASRLVAWRILRANRGPIRAVRHPIGTFWRPPQSTGTERDDATLGDLHRIRQDTRRDVGSGWGRQVPVPVNDAPEICGRLSSREGRARPSTRRPSPRRPGGRRRADQEARRRPDRVAALIG